jgi:hypothetical protein
VAFRVLKAVQQAEVLAESKLQSNPAAAAAASAAAPTEAGVVTVCDINPEMLQEGRKRADAQGIPGEAATGHQRGQPDHQ